MRFHTRHYLHVGAKIAKTFTLHKSLIHFVLFGTCLGCSVHASITTGDFLQDKETRHVVINKRSNSSRQVHTWRTILILSVYVCVSLYTPVTSDKRIVMRVKIPSQLTAVEFVFYFRIAKNGFLKKKMMLHHLSWYRVESIYARFPHIAQEN